MLPPTHISTPCHQSKDGAECALYPLRSAYYATSMNINYLQLVHGFRPLLKPGLLRKIAHHGCGERNKAWKGVEIRVRKERNAVYARH